MLSNYKNKLNGTYIQVYIYICRHKHNCILCSMFTIRNIVVFVTTYIHIYISHLACSCIYCWEERRLRVFENRVLRRVFEPKREEVTGEWRKLHNEEFSDLYSLPNIMRVVKSRRMRWAGHVARMGEGKGVHRVLVGKPEGKRPLGRPRRRWGIILRWIFRKWEGVVRTGWS